MRVSSMPCPQPTIPRGLPGRPPTPPPPEDRTAKLIDTLKRRSSIVNMLDPVAMTLSLVSKPLETFSSVTHIAGAVFSGQTSDAQAQIESLVHRAVHPVAPYSYAYKGGQVLGAVVDGTVGALEIAQGVRHGDPYMGMMGMADVLGGTASAVVAAGFPGTSLVMTLAAAGAKSGVVLANPGGFTRVQKMKTCFDASFAVATSMLRAGVGVVPALGAQALLATTELAYMNHEGFQQGADAAIDWVGAKIYGAQEPG